MKGGSKAGVAKSTLRINLGSHMYMSRPKLNLQRTGSSNAKYATGSTLDDDKLDGVLEVLGYLAGTAKHSLNATNTLHASGGVTVRGLMSMKG